MNSFVGIMLGSALLQYDGSDEDSGQVGRDGQDRRLLRRRGPHGAGHSAGGHQLPGSGIHRNLLRWVSNVQEA